MPVKLPSIPDIPFGEASKKWLDPIKETLEIWRGGRRSTARKLDALVSYQDLIDLGLITEEDVPR